VEQNLKIQIILELHVFLEEKKGFSSPVGGHNYVVAANTKHLDETWKLVDFLTQPKNQAKFAIRNNLLQQD
jgi:ABC-type glycerol-3-phosphate transport system substrate-binding protein